MLLLLLLRISSRNSIPHWCFVSRKSSFGATFNFSKLFNSSKSRKPSRLRLSTVLLCNAIFWFDNFPFLRFCETGGLEVVFVVNDPQNLLNKHCDKSVSLPFFTSNTTCCPLSTVLKCQFIIIRLIVLASGSQSFNVQ